MTTDQPFRIATRGSQLALWQANYVAQMIRPLLASRTGGRAVEVVVIHTTGDQVRDLSLSAIGGQGVFTKEIQQALIDRKADLAVHSLKDLPTEASPGLALAAVPPRAPTGDAFISLKHQRFDALPQGARIATGSARRRAQILHRRPDLALVDIRGNVDTRLRKLHEQGLDGLILAVAGLERLGLANQVTEVLDEEWMLPAVGQGALGLECRADDTATLTLARQLNHEPSMEAVLAERALLRTLGGGCQLPIGALGTVGHDRQSLVLSPSLHSSEKQQLAELEHPWLRLRCAVCSPDGKQRLADEMVSHPRDPESIGITLAERLLQQGARELLT